MQLIIPVILALSVILSSFSSSTKTLLEKNVKKSIPFEKDSSRRKNIQNSSNQSVIINRPPHHYPITELVYSSYGTKKQFSSNPQLSDQIASQFNALIDIDRKPKQNEIPGVNYFVMEVQVLFDSVLETAIGTAKVTLFDYINTFFHTVNNMYKMSHPDDETFPAFKLKVVNLERLTEAMESGIFQPVDGQPDIMDIEKVLARLRKHTKTGKYDKYDHTILLTGRDLYRRTGDQYEADVLGVAYLKGACTQSTDSKYNALSVVEDVGGHFLGVYAAVHEIAHNLGVKHDSKAPTTEYNCHAKRGYIMSPVTQRTSNMFKFSDCSLESLKTFFLSKQGKCLAKGKLKPIFKEETNKFPGDFYTMQMICEQVALMNFPNEIVYEVYVNSAKSPSYLCKQISCKVTVSGRKYTLEPTFAFGENTPCGDGKRCVSGECINKS